MPIQQWINMATDNLKKASDSYADIQRQLDRYNKVFETYAQASPETQMRAASVMRQAINEYNWLKKQQEQNAIKIYEAQQRVNYYKENTPWVVQPKQYNSVWEGVSPGVMTEWTPIAQTETIPVMNVSTPWTLNNNTPIPAQVNAIDTNTTMNVPNVVSFPNNNTISPTMPVWLTNYINSQTPQYGWTTMWPVDNRTATPKTTNWSNYYWQGNVATYNWTGSIASISNLWTYNNTTSSTPGRKFWQRSSRRLATLWR